MPKNLENPIINFTFEPLLTIIAPYQTMKQPKFQNICQKLIFELPKQPKTNYRNDCNLAKKL